MNTFFFLFINIFISRNLSLFISSLHIFFCKTLQNVIFLFLSRLKINVFIYFFVKKPFSRTITKSIVFSINLVSIVNFFCQHEFFSVIKKSLIPFKIFYEVLITLLCTFLFFYFV